MCRGYRPDRLPRCEKLKFAPGDEIHGVLIFGTKGREEPCGVVADMCPSCQKVRAFLVVEHYEAAHVYWVSMGQGTLRGTSIRCLECNCQCHFEAHKYRQVLSHGEASRCDLKELVERTHPQLAPRWRCGGCGFERDTPFHSFCNNCGGRIG